MSKVRIINEKTGEIRFVSQFIAKQDRELKKYGWKVQDLNVTNNDNVSLQKQEPAVETHDENPDQINEEVDLLSEETNNELEVDLVEDTEDVHIKKKPGRKPKTQVTE